MTREIKSRPIGPLITKNWERKKAIWKNQSPLFSKKQRNKYPKCHSKEDITTHERIQEILCPSLMLLKGSVYK